MWLEAPESKYQEEEDLLENPGVENAEMIICWTISGVIVEVVVEHFVEPVLDWLELLGIDEPTKAVKAVKFLFGGLIGHSLRICPFFFFFAVVANFIWAVWSIMS